MLARIQPVLMHDARVLRARPRRHEACEPKLSRALPKGELQLIEVAPVVGVEHCGEQRHRYVFTASVAEHAERCLKKIGIPLDAFYNIVDTRTCRLETKHSWQAFDCAMVAAGTADHAECVLMGV